MEKKTAREGKCGEEMCSGIDEKIVMGEIETKRNGTNSMKRKGKESFEGNGFLGEEETTIRKNSGALKRTNRYTMKRGNG